MAQFSMTRRSSNRRGRRRGRGRSKGVGGYSSYAGFGRDDTKMIARSSSAGSGRDMVDRALTRVRRAQETEKKEKAANESMTQQLVQTAEVFGTPVALTYAQVRGWIPTTLFGVPVSLGGGILLRLISAYMDGNGADHVRNIGDGMLAQYGTVLGSQLAGGLGRVAGNAAVGCAPGVGCGVANMAGMMGMQPGMPVMPQGTMQVPMQVPGTTEAEIVDIMRRYGWA